MIFAIIAQPYPTVKFWVTDWVNCSMFKLTIKYLLKETPLLIFDCLLCAEQQTSGPGGRLFTPLRTGEAFGSIHDLDLPRATVAPQINVDDITGLFLYVNLHSQQLQWLPMGAQS